MKEVYNKILREKLDDKRYKHCVNVAEKAVYLARRYGADVDKAWVAGILHDVTKQTIKDEQRNIIERAGMKLSDLENGLPKLWHAVSGAAYLKQELGIDDEEILNAVRYHTTGRAGMSLLEKVVFVADMISDDRTFDGVEEVRQAAEESLDKAVCLTAIRSIEWLVEKRATIAYNTVDVYNDTVKSLILSN